ncbi:MAG: hypothetical protein Q8S73_17770 [Deltaproteobacteria bacterium]|nr:hypothetical protein [Myxococcales bacterium]MDP3215960.1 hypothetical protein [Deltaproteobacteria bacterium]
MGSFTVSPRLYRWYFEGLHYSQFSNWENVLGSCDAATSFLNALIVGAGVALVVGPATIDPLVMDAIGGTDAQTFVTTRAVLR